MSKSFGDAVERYESLLMSYEIGLKVYPKTYLQLVHDCDLYIMPFRDVDGSGKMLMIPALTTISFGNDRCKDRALRGEGICADCYVKDSMNLGPEMLNLTHNLKLLSSSILTEDQIDRVARKLVKLATTGMFHDGMYYAPSMQVRIESKGDTANAIHAHNYNLIAKRIHEINPAVSVTAWTKNADFYSTAFKWEKKNLRMVYSALATGIEGYKECKRIKEMYPWFDVCFVCYEGGKTGSTAEIDTENETFVKQMFGTNAIACKCQKFSCGSICRKCYHDSDITVFENIRKK